jgi:tetratricopeptide (TPR) repeat protein
MKGLMLKAVLLGLFFAMVTAFAAAQGSAYASVHGKCKDAQGAPVVDAEIVWKNQNDGRTYKLKTNKKGEFFSLGVEAGQYTITLTKDGKVLDEQKNVHVGIEEFNYDVDLKQAQEQSIKQAAKKTGASTEQVKQQQAEAEKAQQYNASVKAVNEKLNAAAALMKAQPPDYAQAIAMYKEAATMVPDEDIVWFRLGSAYLDSARAQTDAAERTKQNTEAYNDIQKAIEIKKGAGSAAKPAAQAAGANAATPDGRLAAYYDNLGAAAARLGKIDEAGNDYQEAAQTDPPNAARYYFNLGVTLHNFATDTDGKKKAADAFGKAIAADPTKADAYFLKGSDLFALIEEKNGKMVAPDGTAEAFQKYLELQPSGPHAEEAKQMLAALNSSVESTYGTKKGSTPKKK